MPNPSANAEIYNIQGVSKILGQNSGVNDPHQNKETFHINICPQTVFEVQLPPPHIRPNSIL
jgi:hypothetical protein